MAFDKLTIMVPGRVSAASEAPPQSPLEVFDSYRSVLAARSDANRWTPPGSWPTRFETRRIGNGDQTVDAARIKVIWANTVHEMTLRLALNPTRTARHVLSLIPENADALGALEMMEAERFFCRSGSLEDAGALDDSDNLFPSVDWIRERLGEDPAGQFISIYERKLKSWVLEAVAPRDRGFVHDIDGSVVAASNGVHRVSLAWERLFLRTAEIYCERRHSEAPALMNRLSADVLASHSVAGWQAYPINDIGGRQAKSLAIGVKPTGRVRQLFYAKRVDRVRVETQYSHRVRDNLRGHPVSAAMPLSDLLLALRVDAVRRIQWEAFATMCEEPPEPMVADFARMAVEITRCSTRAKVDPEPVFAELMASGGLEPTSPDGRFPMRLLRALERRGVISGESLLRRARPMQARRYQLTQPYRQIAVKMRQAFSSGEATAPEQPEAA